MIPRRPRATPILALLLAVTAALPAQQGSSSGERLVVGLREAEPFVMRAPDGSWRGISVDLWTQVALRLGVESEFVPLDLQPLLDSTAAGRVDVAVAALTVTPERERVMDFTQPWFVSGLAIAVSEQQSSGWTRVVRQFFSLEFLRVAMGLSVVLLIVGAAVWFFERRSNPDQFQEKPLQGLGDGFWWSAVTMTTVGYGDKAPATFGGRMVALFWMFAALVIISSFTAAITSALTLGGMQGTIEGPADLARVSTGTIAGSSSADYLDQRGIGYDTLAGPEALVAALREQRVEAVVYDEPILRYQARRDGRGTMTVLPPSFARQYYAFALPPGSPLRERMNLAILEVIRGPGWRGIVEQYIGDEP